ncbi:MAG: hypothetical protein IPM37_03415 [Hahellaceae bacterium]|nr:hypothetical protein [Hahellaceae bacterium]
MFEDTDGAVNSRLVDWKRPVALIPSLAIHLTARSITVARSILRKSYRSSCSRQ